MKKLIEEIGKYRFCWDREVTAFYSLGHWYDRVKTRRGRETRWLKTN